ncbi:MAG: HD domain-containing protein [Anaerovorax sp.]
MKNENKKLNRDDCLELLREYGTPPHVIRHCMGVARTALQLGHALNEKGYQLDLDLIERSALLHDIARVEKEHWIVGADFMTKLGLVDEAAIIRQHMTYGTDPSTTDFKELDIVCLADRMVREDQFVGFQQRMNSILKKFKGDKAAEKRIRGRMAETEQVIKNIEIILGIPIDKLIEL